MGDSPGNCPGMQSTARFSPLQGASHRGTMYSWHLVQAIHNQTMKPPKASQELHCKLLIFSTPAAALSLRALGGVWEAFRKELKQLSSLLASDASSFLEQQQLAVPLGERWSISFGSKCSATSRTVNRLRNTNLHSAKPLEHRAL